MDEEHISDGAEILTMHQKLHTLDDEAFFIDLPTLLSDVGEKLSALLEIEATSIGEMKTMTMLPVDPVKEEEEEEEEAGENEGATEEANVTGAAEPDVGIAEEGVDASEEVPAEQPQAEEGTVHSTLRVAQYVGHIRSYYETTTSAWTLAC